MHDDPTPLQDPAQPDLQALLKTQGCTHLLLRQLMRRVAQLYDLEMAKVGLKTTQYSLLSHVQKLGPLRPGELARKMKFTPSTLTRNLKPLIDAGWVALAAGNDGRSRTVTITPAGQAKREIALRHWKVAQAGLNERLGGSRVLALHGLMNDALERLRPVETETETETGAEDE